MENKLLQLQISGSNEMFKPLTSRPLTLHRVNDNYYYRPNIPADEDSPQKIFVTIYENKAKGQYLIQINGIHSGDTIDVEELSDEEK
jgi:hypothetical protein